MTLMFEKKDKLVKNVSWDYIGSKNNKQESELQILQHSKL